MPENTRKRRSRSYAKVVYSDDSEEYAENSEYKEDSEEPEEESTIEESDEESDENSDDDDDDEESEESEEDGENSENEEYDKLNEEMDAIDEEEDEDEEYQDILDTLPKTCKNLKSKMKVFHKKLGLTYKKFQNILVWINENSDVDVPNRILEKLYGAMENAKFHILECIALINYSFKVKDFWADTLKNPLKESLPVPEPYSEKAIRSVTKRFSAHEKGDEDVDDFEIYKNNITELLPIIIEVQKCIRIATCSISTFSDPDLISEINSHDTVIELNKTIEEFISHANETDKTDENCFKSLVSFLDPKRQRNK